MRIGIFADSHDHLDNIRSAVTLFNHRQCECVIFAGDLVSTFALPPLRKLACPLIACYGDNEGNKPGLQAGLRRGDVLGEPPFCYRSADGTRFVLAHMERQFRGAEGEFDICICAHTHKPSVSRDEQNRLLINPGETSGWTFQNPTVMILETRTREVEIVSLLVEAS
jgi:uncharacterized protein